MFVGLNPSTADETADDPTLTRCVNFAKSWGYGGVCMANLFAFRATQPTDMMVASDPIGSDNNKWLHMVIAFASHEVESFDTFYFDEEELIAKINKRTIFL